MVPSAIAAGLPLGLSGAETLRGCPTARGERGTFYYEPDRGYDEARAVELVR